MTRSCLDQLQYFGRYASASVNRGMSAAAASTGMPRLSRMEPFPTSATPTFGSMNQTVASFNANVQPGYGALVSPIEERLEPSARTFVRNL